MIDVSDLPEDERGILRLLDASNRMQTERQLDELDRLLDVGDRILAQRIVKDAAASSDPTTAEATP